MLTSVLDAVDVFTHDLRAEKGRKVEFCLMRIRAMSLDTSLVNI